MPRQILSVFLSSTWRDLPEFRQAAIAGITSLDGYECTNMEGFGARDAPAEEFCRAAVRNCDLLVGIVGHLHGACPPGSDRSYTEIEYDEARERCIPRLMFVAPANFPMASDIRESDEQQAKQQAFREQVELERIRASFRTADQLRFRIAEAIQNWEHSQVTTIPSGQIDFTRLLDLHTNFVGRAWLRDGLDAFIREGTGGYFLIEGKPGIGKTSFAAHLVRTRGYLHHFNSLKFGIVKTEQFLRNICAQLHSRHAPNFPKPTEKQFGDSQYLTDLLFWISKHTPSAGPLVIIVDALDESEGTPVVGTNPLALPGVLPPNAVFVLTRRDTPHFFLDSNPKVVNAIDAKSKENLADVHEFLAAAIKKPRIEAFRRSAGLDETSIIRLLLDKSEGNFMYITRVVPAIEAGEYETLGFRSLPQGLKEYYERHWHKISERNLGQWARIFLPTVGALAVAREPLSAMEIRAFVSRRIGTSLSRLEISAALHEIREFLETTTIDGERSYSLYHSSFREFLERTDEIQEFLH